MSPNFRVNIDKLMELWFAPLNKYDLGQNSTSHAHFTCWEFFLGILELEKFMVVCLQNCWLRVKNVREDKNLK